MFVDKNKIEAAYLDELTRLGNMFDTLNIGYGIIGEFALSGYGIRTRRVTECTVIAEVTNKSTILETLFKLNFTIKSLTVDSIDMVKVTKPGELHIKLILSIPDGKDSVVLFENRKIRFPPKFLNNERKEVWASSKGKGYFKVAPLELIYFLKMNTNKDEDVMDLEIIKGSGKMDIDKLFKLFEINGLI
jgi:hypothetical protein